MEHYPGTRKRGERGYQEGRETSVSDPGHCPDAARSCGDPGKKTPAKTVKQQLQRRLRLIWAFYTRCSEYRWGKRRSRIIGLSSLMYVLPSLALFPVCHWEAWLWALVSVLSFNADYVFAGMRDSLWICAAHMIDRYVASLMLGVQIVWNIPLWFSKGIVPGATGTLLIVISCILKYVGERTRSYDRHVVYHSAWHLVGGLGRLLVAVLEYPKLLKEWY